MNTRPRPRILLVLLDGGARHGTANAAHELIRRGLSEFDFTVVSTRLIEELSSQVDFIRIPAPGGPYRLRWLVFYVLTGLRRAFVNADLVHALAPAPLLPGKVDLVTVLFSQVAYYQTESQPGGFTERAARWFATRLENRAYRPGRVRMLTALAPGGKRELERDHPGLPVIVAPHVLQAERFYPDDSDRNTVREELGAEPGEPVACFVNNTFWVHKGLDIAMEGLALARRTVPAVGTLWVVGDGPVDTFRNVADHFGLGARVKFLGSRRDIERIYRGADFLVHPARYETFSLAVHESAASGLPVIATRTNGVEDLVEDGAAGILIPRDARAVAEAVISIVQDPARAARMGAEGRRRALSFDADGFTGPVIEAYRALLAN